MMRYLKTYQEVARELSEGLASGSVTLEEEPMQNEIGGLAALLFEYLPPRKFAFARGGSTSIGLVAGSPKMMIQIDPKAYENLPGDVKASFLQRTKKLREKGVKIKIKDLKGKVFSMSVPDERADDGVVPARSRR
jgi:hypothetical protein